MKKCYAFIADSNEEGEYINVVDILKRAGIETITVSITGSKEVKFSHGIVMHADCLIEDKEFDDADVIFLPGGMPGSSSLSNDKRVIALIKNQLEQNKRVAAICAAPAVVLGYHGLLEGKKATCYPGFEQYLKGAEYCKDKVVTDGLISTARGLGASMELGFELVKLLLGEIKATEVARQIQYLI